MGAAVAAAGGRLRYIHIGESHRGYLGTGSVDFQGGSGERGEADGCLLLLPATTCRPRREMQVTLADHAGRRRLQWGGLAPAALATRRERAASRASAHPCARDWPALAQACSKP